MKGKDSSMMSPEKCVSVKGGQRIPVEVGARGFAVQSVHPLLSVLKKITKKCKLRRMSLKQL